VAKLVGFGMNRKPIFDCVRKMLGRGFTDAEVAALDLAIDEATGVIVVRAPKPKGRQINRAGEQLIQSFEGCELEAYLDVAGIPTIGWGHTGPEVKLGQKITQAEADRLFDLDTDRFEAAVDSLTKGHATDNQFAALVSFAYNVGAEALKTSTLLRKHNSGDYAGAAAEFGKWNKARVGGKLVVVKGLTRRREAEAALYRRP
jgi:lysozyme